MDQIERLKKAINELVEETSEKETLLFIWEFLVSKCC